MQTNNKTLSVYIDLTAEAEKLFIEIDRIRCAPVLTYNSSAGFAREFPLLAQLRGLLLIELLNDDIYGNWSYKADVGGAND